MSREWKPDRRGVPTKHQIHYCVEAAINAGSLTEAGDIVRRCSAIVQERKGKELGFVTEWRETGIGNGLSGPREGTGT